MFKSGIKMTAMSGLAVALLTTSAAAQSQWTGSVNTTKVPAGDPPSQCWIFSLADAIAIMQYSLQPCTCTGGKVTPECNWQDYGILYNRVSESVCKCSEDQGPYPEGSETLKAYTSTQPQGVIGCLCDPPAEGAKIGSDGLQAAGPACWCPADGLAEKSGLADEAKEDKAAPPPPSASPASTESCPIDWVVFPNNVNCSCRNPTDKKTCAADASGKSRVLLSGAVCSCGEFAFSQESDIKNCICTNELENESREKCVCSSN
ncbi:hypothetical protein CDD82_7072 [Ophiocordyceps australis]|uniref:Uncharacterized protein n=1 Tax=Ophiocordyceps australis TaxID=1399860 RepID=A0A2C5ZLY4_9HYPO|nr:hypothetical protein CDD82_7072 [Ophiocordyceps australis]